MELHRLTRDEIIKRLRDGGHKVTPQRLAICEFIMNRNDHPNAEQILVELQKQHPTISKATIYNTLHVMNKAGLIQELGFSSGITRFEPDLDFHINQVCQECGTIVDMKDHSVEKAWNGMIASNNITPTGQRLDVYIICGACKALEKK